jgi:hypothetical protein
MNIARQKTDISANHCKREHGNNHVNERQSCVSCVSIFVFSFCRYRLLIFVDCEFEIFFHVGFFACAFNLGVFVVLPKVKDFD